MGYPIKNTTGWAELYDGNLIGAVYTMYNTVTAGWIVAMLFILFQTILFIKTKNPMLCAGTGIFFGALYAVSVFVETASIQIIFVILAFEVAGIIYVWLVK